MNGFGLQLISYFLPATGNCEILSSVQPQGTRIISSSGPGATLSIILNGTGPAVSFYICREGMRCDVHSCCTGPVSVREYGYINFNDLKTLL